MKFFSFARVNRCARLRAELLQICSRLGPCQIICSIRPHTELMFTVLDVKYGPNLSLNFVSMSGGSSLTNEKNGSSSVRCMSFEAYQQYQAVNEPVKTFLPGSEERHKLDEAIARYDGKTMDIPIVIGDEEIRNNQEKIQVAPFDHHRQIAKFYHATPDLVQKAIDTAVAAREEWELTPIQDRAEIFLRAADLCAGKYRYDLLATTMLGQSKNMYQAEIDAAAELIDFYRFNVMFGAELTKYQPISTDISKNSFRLRGLEGFWAAIAPFNFTAIGANLATAPCIMGNVTLWKPSDTAVLSNFVAYKILREAGLPAGVINFLPSEGPVFGDVITASPHLAGINFTGSAQTFSHLWKQVGQNIENYRLFPRLIGECGGKNFHLAHPSADMESVVNATTKSAFEFSGQKCSACSRLYVPQSAWKQVKEGLIERQAKLKVGSPLEADTYLSAVIDDKAFARIKSYLDHAKSSPNVEIIAGGTCDDSKGYFVEPTIIETKDPRDRLMKEEIFGPVVTVYAYPDSQFEEVVDLANNTSPFGLTGALFSQDRDVIVESIEKLRHATGNFYINDQSTGSIVGQQPFGGGRKSGTNDKAGGPHYMLKFASPQSTKETIVPIRRFDYDYMKN